VSRVLSLASDTQHFIHGLFGFTRPQGWNNQVGGSLGLLAAIEQRRALNVLSSGNSDGVQLHSDWYGRLTVGNIFTCLAGGVSVNIGKDLPAVSGAPRGTIQPSVVAESIRASGVRDCFFQWLACTAFGSFEVRAVGYNAFLDGRLWREDPHVVHRPIVSDTSAGIRLDFPMTGNALTGPWFLQFRATYRSAEFKSNFAVPGERFGSLTAGTDF
jgi:lipid A 3-O-deacylase